MNTTTQTASLKNVKKVFMIATAAEAIFMAQFENLGELVKNTIFVA